ncbi:hypothetical protein FA13DRAFT_1738360 [Coprinellus micaceus]|uniref:Uncharacterized protein n=1 Tax=Coprinellus micaceus TaxID=71717 RepID=A0A4Y7SUF6_COPMI|nr:hypothetical protein FA13DRAFT_1738360 [Coprinellus micaceus]
MWETYLGGGGLVGYGGHNGSGSGYGSGYGYGGGEKGAWGGWSAAAAGGEAKEWDGIKPVSVSYVASTPAPSSKAAASGASTSGSDSAAPPTQRRQQEQQQAQAQQPNRGMLREAGTFVADLFRTPRMPVLPQAVDGGSNVPPAKDGERTVRVAVLIAMPRPPSLASHPSLTSLSPPEASGSNSGSHPLAESTPRIAQGNGGDNDETPLPVLEIGVAEVTVVVGHEDGDGEARRMSGESVELKKGAQAEGASAPPAV